MQFIQQNSIQNNRQKGALQISKAVLLGGIAIFVVIGILLMAIFYNPNKKADHNADNSNNTNESGVINSNGTSSDSSIIQTDDNKNATTSLLNSKLSVNTNRAQVNIISDGKILEIMNKNYGATPNLILQKVTDGKFNNQANAGKSSNYRAAVVLARGDMNNDGLSDVMLETSICDPTCSYGLDAVLNNKSGSPEYIMLNTSFYAGYGAKTKIKSVVIDRNIITIVGQDFLDVEVWGTDVTKRVRYEGGNLIEIK